MAKTKNVKPKVKYTQKFTLQIIHYEDGTSTMKRLNNGFSVIEMLGITNMITNDLLALLRSSIKPVDEMIRKSTNSPIIHKPKVHKIRYGTK